MTLQDKIIGLALLADGAAMVVLSKKTSRIYIPEYELNPEFHNLQEWAIKAFEEGYHIDRSAAETLVLQHGQKCDIDVELPF